MFDDIFQDRNEICLRFNFTSKIIKNPKLKKKRSKNYNRVEMNIYS